MPFPELFIVDETNYATLTTGTVTDLKTGLPIPDTTTMATVAGQNMTAEPYGRPAAPAQAAIMPFATVNSVVTEFGVPLAVLSVIANGSDQIAVTCSRPHGLATNGQISVEGLTFPGANGFFSVIVTTATAFTYQTYATSVPAGSLLGPRVRMVTAHIGLPRGYGDIQQVGP